MRGRVEDILLAIVDWLDLHITAWRLGVSVGWLRERQSQARAFLAEYE